MIPAATRETLNAVLNIVLVIVMSSAIALTSGKQAIAARPAETVTVHLGTPSGELRFVPDQLQFRVGQRYALALDNPSPEKHYFTAKDFADAIWTQKVDAGSVEIKGAIHDLELRPGAEAEWSFVPQKPGTYELHCSIPGHAEAGMRGVIIVVD